MESCEPMRAERGGEQEKRQRTGEGFQAEGAGRGGGLILIPAYLGRCIRDSLILAFPSSPKVKYGFWEGKQVHLSPRGL